MMLKNVRRNLKSFVAIRELKIDNSVIPALQFNPVPDNGEKDTSLESESDTPETGVLYSVSVINVSMKGR